MHEVIAFLKEAVTRGPGAGISSCYVAKDDHIYARGQAVQAGIAWPIGGAQFSVRADDLDSALSRIKNITDIAVERDAIILKGGRLKTTIKRHFDEPPPLPDFPDNWTSSPPGLALALKRAKPFVGDRAWMVGVNLVGDKVIAMNGRVAIELDLPGLEAEVPIILPESATAFLIAQGDPDEMAMEGNSTCFRWDDGRWMRAQHVADRIAMKQVNTIFADAGEETPTPVTDEWREALADAAAMSDEVVELTYAGFRGVKESVSVDVELDVDLDVSHKSYWSSKLLGLVLAEATAWQPAAWPQPALFVGEGCRGLIVGMRR